VGQAQGRERHDGNLVKKKTQTCWLSPSLRQTTRPEGGWLTGGVDNGKRTMLRLLRLR
jgi:hypothetical protein